jgi:hypothetical protein
MKIKKYHQLLYFISSFTPIIYVILNIIQNSLQSSYSKNFELPLYIFFLNVLTPMIVSVLFFIKIFLQKEMFSRLSRNLNILVTVLLIMGIILFYNIFDLLHFVSVNPMLTFMFCLQLCSLCYDLFLKKTPIDLNL